MTPQQATNLPWHQPGWLEQAGHWIREQIERRDSRIIGEIQQVHARPWSTVLRIPTSEGSCYFKATAPALAYEPALTQALSRWRPDCMPQVLAAAPEHGWMLMADSGATLRKLLAFSGDIHHWQWVLPLYAELQIELSQRLDEIRKLGVLDRRLEVLPPAFERLLADRATLRAGLSRAEHRRLCLRIPHFSALCARLAAFRLPETLYHDDFHDGNIFVYDGRYTFADWGESCAGHPFFTLSVTLRSISARLAQGGACGELERLRDAYLEPWLRFAARDDLLEALRLAQQVGAVGRALTWYRVVTGMDAGLREEYAEAVSGWLQEFLSE